MKLIVMAIFATVMLGGCSESPEFLEAEAAFNSAHNDLNDAYAKGDHAAMREAFRREQAALKKEIETCVRCKKNWKNDPDIKAILTASP